MVGLHKPVCGLWWNLQDLKCMKPILSTFFLLWFWRDELLLQTNHSMVSFKSISTPHWQTPLFIKSCSKIVQILLLSDINGPFYSGHFPLKADLDNDYYLFRCKDINGLWIFKRTFMTFLGGDGVIKRYSIIK
jgi:hypothetical protein